MFICKHRAFKRSTFRLNAIICIAIFLGFLGDFMFALSVSFLESVTAMDVISNVSPSCCLLYHTAGYVQNTSIITLF